MIAEFAGSEVNDPIINVLTYVDVRAASPTCASDV